MTRSDLSFKIFRRTTLHTVLRWLACTAPACAAGRATETYTFSTLPNGIGNAAMLNFPSGAVVDSRGYFFVADFGNHAIRQVSPDGVVTTFAGTMTQTGTRDGTGAAARFWGMNVIGIDGADNLYVLDARPGNFSYFTSLRKITPRGEVSTIVTSGTEWGVPSQAGYWWTAYCMAVDRVGNVYLHDGQKDQITKVSPAGVVTPFFIRGSGFANVAGPMAVDAAGNVFVTDWISKITRITPTGATSSVITRDSLGLFDGPGGKVQLDLLDGITVDAQGTLFVTDHTFAGVYRITPDGAVSVVAGGNGNGYPSDGNGRAARFGSTRGICVDRAGNLYVADTESIRKVTPTGDTTIFVGTAQLPGAVDGVGGVYELTPRMAAVNGSGDVFVADTNAIRKIARSGEVSTLAGHLGSPGHEDGTGDAARFTGVAGMVFGPDGNLYVAEYSCVRRVSPSGVVTTLAGHPTDGGRVDGPVTVARFSQLRGIAVGVDGAIYVSDYGNNAVRKISLDGQVTTFAGKLGDRGTVDGPAGIARIFDPGSLAVAPDGALYLHDLQTIRRIDPSGGIQTIAGRLAAQQTVDGLGSAARLADVTGFAVDRFGNLFFTETGRVRMMTPDGMVTTIGGAPADPLRNQLGRREGEGLNARFNVPSGITADARGRLFFADGGNNCVWRATTPLTEARSQLTNISTRSFVGSGDQTQIAGFAVAGSAAKQVLIRASGPALHDTFGLAGALADPALRLFQGANATHANIGWGTASNPIAISEAAARIGAFRWVEASQDSALLVPLTPGAYTAQVLGAAGGSGTALIEIYDADPASDSRLINLSTRTYVASGDNIQIAGFVIAGPQVKQVLIRASGPALQTTFGLSGVLPAPTLMLYRGSTVVRTNTRWGTAVSAVEIKEAAARAGAFPWVDSSLDSAILTTLEPGAYTAHIFGATQSSGVVLVEIYDVD